MLRNSGLSATAELLLIERNEEHEARLKAEARANAAVKKYKVLARSVKHLLKTLQIEKPTSEIEEVLTALRSPNRKSK